MPGNLAALRELALRRTAQRVDAQMVDYMRAHAISGPWEAGEKLLVAVNARPGAAALIRQARRLADRLRAPWTAMHVETGGRAKPNATGWPRRCAWPNAWAAWRPRCRPPAKRKACIQFARANNVTHIVTCRGARAARWRRLVAPDLARQLHARAPAISTCMWCRRAAPSRDRKDADARAALAPRAFAGAWLFSAAALGVGLLLRQTLAVSNVALVLLVAVLASAVSLWPVAVAVRLPGLALAYNFFFLPPLYTFTIAEPENIVTLAVFMLVAVIASNLTARVRTQAIVARERAATTEDLYRFSRKLAGVVTLDDLLWATAYQVAHMLKLHVVLLLPEGEGPGGARRLSAGRHAGRGRSRRRPLGL